MPANPTPPRPVSETPLVVIWSDEHRAYWGPNRSGYFTDPCSAGRYTREDAEKATHGCGPEKMIEIRPAPICRHAESCQAALSRPQRPEIVVNCPDCGKPTAQARAGEAVFLCANLDCNPRRLKMPSHEWLRRKIVSDPDEPGCFTGPAAKTEYPHTGPHRDDPALLHQAVVECLGESVAKMADDPCAPTLGGLLIYAWEELNARLEEANTKIAAMKSLTPPPSPARARFDAIMADIPKAGCIHGTPFADICEQCVASDEFDPLNVLAFCEGAIRDAIELDDGLDGAAGEAVLSMIRTARARAIVPAQRPQRRGDAVEASKEEYERLMLDWDIYAQGFTDAEKMQRRLGPALSGRGDVSDEALAWLMDFILPEPLLDDDGEPRMASATEQMESDHASRILSALDGQRREGK